MTDATTIRFTVELFAQFWAHPDPAFVAPVLTTEVLGYWPGSEEPARGRVDYTERIAAIIELLPDMRLEVAEHAWNGDIVFIRWVLHATGANGPFDMTGIDRVRVRDGLVAENVIVFDTALFERLSGHRVPWASQQTVSRPPA